MPAEKKDSHQSRLSTVEKKRIVKEIEDGRCTLNEAVERYNIVQKRTVISWIGIYGKDSSVSATRPRYLALNRNEVARAIVSGHTTIEHAVREHGVAKRTILKWLSEFAAKNPLMKHEKLPKVEEAAPDKPVQRQIEDLQLKITALETMIDLAEKKYKLDIRKKCGTKQQ